MNISLYKVDSHLSLDSLHGHFLSHDHNLSDEKNIAGKKLFLYTEKFKREEQDWLGFLKGHFNLNADLGEKLNAILVVQLSSHTLYVIPFGHGYTKLSSVIDVEFGMAIAEKQLLDKNIKGKKIDYYLQNKIREITTLNEDWIESATPNQSYREVSGSPKDTQLFGNTIDCSDKVRFNVYGETNNELMDNILYKVEKFDETLRAPSHGSTIPRVKLIKKREKDLINDLNSKMNMLVKEDSEDVNVVFTGMAQDGDLQEFVSLERLTIYKKRIKKDNEIEINNLQDLIKIMRDESLNLSDIRARLSNGDNDLDYDITHYLDITMQLEGKIYIFNQNRWYILNQTFVDLLSKQLDNIEVELGNDKFKFDYFFDEDGYIESISRKNNFVSIHKKNISGLSAPIEIADLYDEIENELFAVKMGLETDKSLYSIQQSMLSISILKSNDEYNFQNIDEVVDDVDRLKESQKVSIVWVLIDGDTKQATPNRYLQKYANDSLRLEDIKSVLLKLKISEWYTISKSLNIDPKIYFVKVPKRKRPTSEIDLLALLKGEFFLSKNKPFIFDSVLIFTHLYISHK